MAVPQSSMHIAYSQTEKGYTDTTVYIGGELSYYYCFYPSLHCHTLPRSNFSIVWRRSNMTYRYLSKQYCIQCGNMTVTRVNTIHTHISMIVSQIGVVVVTSWDMTVHHLYIAYTTSIFCVDLSLIKPIFTNYFHIHFFLNG